MPNPKPEWNPGEPPKDGELYIILVESSEDNAATEEEDTFRTIGFNNLPNTKEDLWEIAGWNWYTDEFCTTTGKIIGWLPIAARPSEGQVIN